MICYSGRFWQGPKIDKRLSKKVKTEKKKNISSEQFSGKGRNSSIFRSCNLTYVKTKASKQIINIQSKPKEMG